MDRVRKGRKLVYLNGILIRLALSPTSQDHYGSHIRTDRAAMNAALLPGLLQPLIYRGWMDGWILHHLLLFLLLIEEKIREKLVKNRRDAIRKEGEKDFA